MRQIVGPNYDELGFEAAEDDQYLDVLRRASVIETACRHNLQVRQVFFATGTPLKTGEMRVSVRVSAIPI